MDGGMASATRPSSLLLFLLLLHLPLPGLLVSPSCPMFVLKDYLSIHMTNSLLCWAGNQFRLWHLKSPEKETSTWCQTSASKAPSSLPSFPPTSLSAHNTAELRRRGRSAEACFRNKITPLSPHPRLLCVLSFNKNNGQTKSGKALQTSRNQLVRRSHENKVAIK